MKNPIEALEKGEFELHHYHLSNYALIEITGEDAQKFLQGQLTADLNSLAVGESTLTAHCDAKGKISGLFRLLCIAENHYWLMVHKTLLPLALDNLKKYAVFSKVTIDMPECLITAFIGNEESRLELLEHGYKGWQKVYFQHRTLMLKTNPTTGDWWVVEQSAEDEKDWDIADIWQGYPILNAEGQGEFIPQALNLQAIEQAISFQKGCYIGQETVARAKYRGANKLAMYGFKAETENCPELGSPIEMQLENGWRMTGTILSAVSRNGVLWGQIVMSNQLEENQKFRLVSGEEIEILPLKYQLS